MYTQDCLTSGRDFITSKCAARVHYVVLDTQSDQLSCPQQLTVVQQDRHLCCGLHVWLEPLLIFRHCMNKRTCPRRLDSSLGP